MNPTTPDTVLGQDLAQLDAQLPDLTGKANGHSAEQLFALLGHEHPFVRWQAAEKLTQLAAETQTQRQGLFPRGLRRDHLVDMPALLAMATDQMVTSKASYRAALVEALGQWRYTGSLPLLREGLQDADPAVRSASVRALGLNQDTDSTDILLEMLKQDSSHWVRLAAADALGNLGQTRAAPALCDLIRALAEVAPETGNTAQRYMLRLHLANALGHLDHPQARALLMTMAQDEDATLRWHAVRGLQRVGGAAALAVLKPLLADETLLFDKTIGHAALEAMATIRRREQGLVAWLRQAAYWLRMSLKRIRCSQFWRRS